MTKLQLWREFFAWTGSEKKLTLISAIPAVLGSLVISLALTAAHALVVTDVNLSSALVQPHDISVQGSTLQFIILGTVLITSSSVVQSALTKVQAFAVLSYLKRLISGADAASGVHPRNVMVERLAFERWVKTVSNLFQVVGFSLLMIYLEGVYAMLGLLLAGLLALTIALRFSWRAFNTSARVIRIQKEARLLHRPPRRGEEPPTEEALAQSSHELSRAIYDRDTIVFRAPVSIVSIVSIGSAFLALAPPIVMSADLSFAYLMMAVFLWRQRMIEAVTDVGPFMWNFANLLDAYDRLEPTTGRN